MVETSLKIDHTKSINFQNPITIAQLHHYQRTK